MSSLDVILVEIPLLSTHVIVWGCTKLRWILNRWFLFFSLSLPVSIFLSLTLLSLTLFSLLSLDLSLSLSLSFSYTHTHTHTHTHTKTCWFLWLTGTFHRRNGFYTVQTVFSIALHLNLPLTRNIVHFYFLKKTHSVWFISLLNYGDTEIVLHKSPAPCNSYAIPISLYKCVSS